jgi:hypothetical protein
MWLEFHASVLFSAGASVMPVFFCVFFGLNFYDSLEI